MSSEGPSSRLIPAVVAKHIATAMILVVTITTTINLNKDIDAEKIFDQTLYEIMSLELIVQSSPTPSVIHYNFDKLETDKAIPTYGDYELLGIKHVPLVTKEQVQGLGEYTINFIESTIEYQHIKTGEEGIIKRYMPVIKDAGMISYATRNAFTGDGRVLEYVTQARGDCEPFSEEVIGVEREYCDSIVNELNCTYVEAEQDFPREDYGMDLSHIDEDYDNVKCKWEVVGKSCTGSNIICNNVLKIESEAKYYFSKGKKEAYTRTPYFDENPLTKKLFDTYTDICSEEEGIVNPIKIDLAPNHHLVRKGQKVCLVRSFNPLAQDDIYPTFVEELTSEENFNDGIGYDPVTRTDCDFSLSSATDVINSFEDRNELIRCCGFEKALNEKCVLADAQEGSGSGDGEGICGIYVPSKEFLIKEIIETQSGTEERLILENRGDVGSFSEFCGSKDRTYEHDMGGQSSGLASFSTYKKNGELTCIFLEDYVSSRGFYETGGNSVTGNKEVYVVPSLIDCQPYNEKYSFQNSPNKGEIELYCVDFSQHQCGLDTNSVFSFIETQNDPPYSIKYLKAGSVAKPYQMVKFNKIGDNVKLEVYYTRAQNCGGGDALSDEINDYPELDGSTTLLSKSVSATCKNLCDPGEIVLRMEDVSDCGFDNNCCVTLT